MQIPRRKSEMLRMKEPGPLYLTIGGIEKLRDQLAHIERSLPELVQETQRAAAYGDRSENEEYKEAKSALRRANFQILNIKDQLKRAQVIDTTRGSTTLVELGCTVVLESGGKIMTFQIVGPYETDPARGRISFESPLGKALIGRHKGDTIEIQIKDGVRKYLIQEIQ